MTDITTDAAATKATISTATGSTATTITDHPTLDEDDEIIGMKGPDVTVAVIGGGPSGMFFVHAINSMKREAKANVIVTCYEQTSQPGGIWRNPIAPSSSSTDTTTKDMEQQQEQQKLLHNTEADMYDQLWTNGPSHNIEFFDYTFDEHFHNEPVTVYLKRQDLLEYMIGRVTKHCPHFFECHFQFNTKVVHVTYDDTIQKFIIQTLNLIAGRTSTNYYDKCLWACGMNSQQRIPSSLKEQFESGHYRGKMIHSSDTATLEQDVRNKRILLVGGNYSAEDIALQSIKLGVKQVYICCRDATCVVTWTQTWPKGKVQVLSGQEILAVKGNCIQLRYVIWSFHEYHPTGEYHNNIPSTELYDIDTVIFCTGYQPRLDMLHGSLNQGYAGLKPMTSYPFYVSDEVRETWRMKRGILTPYVGKEHIPLGTELNYFTEIIYPYFYRGILISNPNMMFMHQTDAYGSPLFAIEAYAWYFARYVCGCIQIPTVEEMNEYNVKQSFEMLQIPCFRFVMDKQYATKVLSIRKPIFPIHSIKKISPKLWWKVLDAYEQFTFFYIANILRDANHPLQLLDDNNEFNDKAKTLLYHNVISGDHRFGVEDFIKDECCDSDDSDDDHGDDKASSDEDDEETKDDDIRKMAIDDNNGTKHSKVSSEAFDKTFRDYNNGKKFRSIYTKTTAVSLPKNWLDL